MPLNDIIGHVTSFADKLKLIAPHKWVGNADGAKHHFDSIDRVDTGLNVGTASLYIEHDFTDAGGRHKIRAEGLVTGIHFHGNGLVFAAAISLDGLQQDSGLVAVSPKIGLGASGIYHRLAVEYKFNDKAAAKHDYRFDGDV